MHQDQDSHELHVEMSPIAPQSPPTPPPTHDQPATDPPDSTATTTTTATVGALPETAATGATEGDEPPTTTTSTTTAATMASSQDTEVPTSAPAPASVPATPTPADDTANTANTANEDDDAATTTTNTAATPTPAKTAATTADDDDDDDDDAAAVPPPPSSPKAELTRAETEAIGPASDNPAAKPDTTAGPVVVITLLLTSGARHPYKIDEKYLKKRSVEVEKMDPFNISVYTLKELIWRDWREEWEPRPSSPSAIRLISFGRMLDDKQPLRDCRFQAESPNVVHMTVKPQEVVDEEDAKTAKGGSRDHDDTEPTARCRCVIL